MPTEFLILCRGKVLITLTGFTGVLPSTEMVLNWYAEHYGFVRSDLSGVWSQSISVAGMKYEDFLPDKGQPTV